MWIHSRGSGPSLSPFPGTIFPPSAAPTVDVERRDRPEEPAGEAGGKPVGKGNDMTTAPGGNGGGNGRGNGGEDREALEALAAELRAMGEEQTRAAHTAHSEDFAEQLAWRRLTAEHGDRLAEIMDEYGWPTAARVGEDAATSAWRVAQHADRDLSLQRRALRLLEEAVSRGEAHPRQLAFLRDRVLVNEGRPQIYGTQIAGIRDGAPVPWPCADPDPGRVDALRAEVGIAPFAEHVARHAPARPDAAARTP